MLEADLARSRRMASGRSQRFPSRELEDPGVGPGRALAGQADDADMHVAQRQPVDEREERPAIVIQPEAAGEEHDFDRIMHGSARPRRATAAPPPKVLRRTGWLSRQALESMRSWFILGPFRLRPQGRCNQG